MQSIKIIEKLSNANGAPGFEDEVTDMIKDIVKDFCIIQWVDEDFRRSFLWHQGNMPFANGSDDGI